MTSKLLAQWHLQGAMIFVSVWRNAVSTLSGNPIEAS
jgi:hypothetical protein